MDTQEKWVPLLEDTQGSMTWARQRRVQDALQSVVVNHLPSKHALEEEATWNLLIVEVMTT